MIDDHWTKDGLSAQILTKHDQDKNGLDNVKQSNLKLTRHSKISPINFCEQLVAGASLSLTNLTYKAKTTTKIG